MPLVPGDTVPPLVVFRTIGEPVFNSELFRDGPTLLHFFPFAFTGGPGAG
jgi:hypothetical protein